MSAFERFNIRYLSPTMIAQWDAAPATLVLKRVYGLKGKPNAAMWRGDAVEAAMQFLLYNKDKPDALAQAKQLAINTFWHRAAGQIDDDTEKEEANIPGYVEQAMAVAKTKESRVQASQFSVEGFLDDVGAPMVGKMDFIFEDKTSFELKTTTRCPSELDKVSLSHRWQAAFYARVRKAPVTLVYLTPKKFNIFDVMPDDPSLVTLTQAAKSMEVAFERCESGDALLRAVPTTHGSFYWDEESLELYGQALKGTKKPLVGPGTESLPGQGYITFGKHAGKHISECPPGYLEWLLNPKLSDGGTFDVPEDLQEAIREHNLEKAL